MSDMPYWCDAEGPHFERVEKWIEDHRRSTVTITDVGRRVEVRFTSGHGIVSATHYDLHQAIDSALFWWWDGESQGEDSPRVCWSVDDADPDGLYEAMRDRIRADGGA